MTKTTKRKPAAGRRKPAGSGRGWRQMPTTLLRRALAAAAGLLRGTARLAWRLGWRLALVVALLVGAATIYDYTRLPPIEALIDGRVRGSVTLLDRNGEPFAWRGDQFAGKITAATVSPHLLHAIIATEDRRFYRHFGISPRGIASAIRINLAEGRGPFEGNGGSTITQQVAKLLCLGQPYDPKRWENEAAYEADCRRGSLWRKIKEVPFAFALEAKYSKDDILTLYLNRVYLGAGTRGFEAAAQRYFGKSAREVNPAEAAMLAGLLKAPSYYAPTRNLARAQARASLIISLMEEQGYLTPAEAEAARQNPATLSEKARERAGGWFADWVMETVPSFLASGTTEDVIIRTTFDPKIQKAAEEAVKWVFENRVRPGSKAQVALVVMSPDGAVRAMVGGRGKGGGRFNRAIQARRQTGSSFKPFVYAAALDLGLYRFDSRVVDEPVTIDIPGSGPWSPRNYTGKNYGEMSLTTALAQSINTVAVKVAMETGLDRVRAVARGFGLSGELAEGPALALGASEATPLEMTAAYAGFLNEGRAVAPYGLVDLRLRGSDEPLITRSGGPGERVIGREAARQLVYMLNQVIERGSGKRAKLPDRPAAGKTGTTQAARDAWFIGFTADYVAGVWMGYDDNTPLTGVTGGGLPAAIWREAMMRVHEGLPPRPLPMIDPEAAALAEARARLPKKSRQTESTIIEDVIGALFGRPF